MCVWVSSGTVYSLSFFFFQAEDGIRALSGLVGSEIVYKRQEWYGQRNGKGFYIRSKDKKGKPKIEVNPGVAAFLKELGVGSGEGISDANIIDRMMLPMLMESSRCLEDNIVETPTEVDMGLVYGIGFPPFRGGIFRWADTVGLNELLQRAEKHKALGKVYEPTEQIMKMAKDGKLFHPLE